VPDVALGTLAPQHPRAHFNLADEPWIPVLGLDGLDRTFSLRDLLTYAHELDGRLPTADPLEVAAMSRFLISVTYLVHRHAPEADWAAVSAGQAALPAAGIEGALQDLADHLWLFHPRTPFLQDDRLRDAVVNRVPQDVARERVFHPVRTLAPGQPANWFTRNRDTTSPLGLPETARLLVTRHFMLPNGNEMAVESPTETQKQNPGSVGFTSIGSSSQVFMVSATIAASLAANLTSDVAHDDGPTFYTAPDPDPSGPGLLWLYTYSAAGAYLIWREGEACVAHTLRGRRPLPFDEQKALLSQAKQSDPHVVWVPTKDGASLREHKKVIFHPQHSRYRRLEVALSAVEYRDPRSSVLDQTGPSGTCGPNPAALVVTLETSGATTGPQIANAAFVPMDPRPLQLPRDRRLLLLALLRRAGGTSSSLSSHLRYQVRQVIEESRNRASELAASTCDHAQDELWVALEPLLAEVTLEVIAGVRNSPRFTDQEVADSARTLHRVFTEVTAPFAQSSRQRVAIAKGSSRLRDITPLVLQ
jgi:hypothetical protein